jgi:hypothetical protein
MNFLSFFVSLGSIFFIWWLRLNLLFLPSLFVYIDFYVPLVYLSFFMLVFYFSKKFLLSELKIKFLADYFSKTSQFLFFNFKFNEMFLYKFRGVFISFFISFSNSSLFYFFSIKHSSLLFLVVLLFFIIWDWIL